MKRDMDLIRKIAFEVEALKDLECMLDSKLLVIDGYSKEQISYHITLMIECRLVSIMGDARYEGTLHPYFLLHRLTSIGHDFVDNARSDSIWEKTMKSVRENASSVSLSLLNEYLKVTLMQSLGMGR